MPIRSLGYGRPGAKGDAGPQGAQGVAGSAGPTGVKGDTGSIGATGPQGPKGDAGSNASATPLGSAAPQALGTAAAGSSTNASREDHVHPKPAGLLSLVGNVNVTETLLVSLSAGNKRMSLALGGVAVGDKLLAIPNGAPTTGCEVLNAYPASAGNVSIGYSVPLLGVGATYTIPVSVYRVS